jgi:hypothetical protein
MPGHDPEKWTAVFRKDHAPPKYLDHDPFQLDGSWFSPCNARKYGRTDVKGMPRKMNTLAKMLFLPGPPQGNRPSHRGRAGHRNHRSLALSAFAASGKPSVWDAELVGFARPLPLAPAMLLRDECPPGRARGSGAYSSCRSSIIPDRHGLGRARHADGFGACAPIHILNGRTLAEDQPDEVLNRPAVIQVYLAM